MTVYIAFFLVIAILILLAKFFSKPMKILFKLIINSVVGAIILIIINYFGARFGIVIGINLITILVAGILGVPGVIFLILYSIYL